MKTSKKKEKETFSDVVALPIELGSGHFDGVVQEEALGEEAGGCEEGPQVAQVARDALRHSWILNLDDNICTSESCCPVHLPDGRSGEGLLLKLQKTGSPVRSQLSRHHFLLTHQRTRHQLISLSVRSKMEKQEELASRCFWGM